MEHGAGCDGLGAKMEQALGGYWVLSAVLVINPGQISMDILANGVCSRMLVLITITKGLSRHPIESSIMPISHSEQHALSIPCARTRIQSNN